ncbi:MAG: site-specific DNA-methyltransferase, partial [Deltaproteobacteria bacterium]|nr:site-specific DNA-methyltransferase [Deltaproteobacteria bacterium]
MTKKKNSTIKINSTQHFDTRLNIPTEELKDFLNDEELQKTIIYPRDTSLDPQLVWNGKDLQNTINFEVPVVPIYIQEKIHPQVIINDLPRKHVHEHVLPNLFDNFNGFPDDFEKRVDFYHHNGHWQNRLILGDSLLVMSSLANKEGLKGKIQCIYMDPPYGIKFNSNWQVSTRKITSSDDKVDNASRQPEQIKAYRDTWNQGIHSYLPYLRDRLTICQELLTETGSIFIQIGDDNVHYVRCILDEIFGSENFISQISFKTTSGFETKTISSVCDYLLWYAKDKKIVKINRLYQKQDTVEGTGNATYLLLPDGTSR